VTLDCAWLDAQLSAAGKTAKLNLHQLPIPLLFLEILELVMRLPSLCHLVVRIKTARIGGVHACGFKAGRAKRVANLRARRRLTPVHSLHRKNAGNAWDQEGKSLEKEAGSRINKIDA
jgi:hypothetical protein